MRVLGGGGSLPGSAATRLTSTSCEGRTRGSAWTSSSRWGGCVSLALTLVSRPTPISSLTLSSRWGQGSAPRDWRAPPHL